MKSLEFTEENGLPIAREAIDPPLAGFMQEELLKVRAGLDLAAIPTSPAALSFTWDELLTNSGLWITRAVIEQLGLDREMYRGTMSVNYHGPFYVGPFHTDDLELKKTAYVLHLSDGSVFDVATGATTPEQAEANHVPHLLNAGDLTSHEPYKFHRSRSLLGTVSVTATITDISEDPHDEEDEVVELDAQR